MLPTTISSTWRGVTAGTATRLTHEQGHAVGWALVDAAGHLGAGV